MGVPARTDGFALETLTDMSKKADRPDCEYPQGRGSCEAAERPVGFMPKPCLEEGTEI